MRKKVFTRQITVDVYEEDDGQVSIEGSLLDTLGPGASFFTLGRRPADPRPPGVLHNVTVRWRIDRKTREIVDSEGTFPSPAWRGCGDFLPRIESLRGLKLGAGFSKALMERTGLNLGCSHATSLMMDMLRAPWGTYYMQPEMKFRTFQEQNNDNTCHMRREGGPVMQALAKGIDVYADDW